MRHSIVVSSSTKSWALGIEYAVRKSKEGHLVNIIDFSPLMSFSPRSFRRIQLERSLKNSLGFNFLRVHKLNLHSFGILVKLLIFILHTRKMFLHVYLARFLKSKVFVEEAVRVRLAQVMGTKHFVFRQVPIFHLIKHSWFAFNADAFVRRMRLEPSLDVLGVFNGREPLEAIWIRGFLDAKCKVEIYERASSDRKYELFMISPHFHPEWWEKIENFSKSQNELEPAQLNIDQNYLHNRLLGYDSYLGQKWSQFYIGDYLSEKVEGEYVVFFTTSTHEYSPIEEFNCTMGFQNQFTAVKVLKQVCGEIGVNLVIRRHPNSLSPLNGQDYEKPLWDAISDKTTKVFDPRDRVSSHLLAKKSKACFVWRSGIGIETIALGVPTFALGSAKWALDSGSRAWTEDAIRHAISAPTKRDIRHYWKYISYMARGGEDLTFFSTVNRVYAETSLGFRVYPRLFSRLLAKWFSIRYQSSLKRKA